MNIRKAAEILQKNYIEILTLEDTPVSAFHLNYMCDSIIDLTVTGEKAHRWLGYIQGVLVARGLATLDEMKKVNYES